VGQTMGLLLIAPAGWVAGKEAKNLASEMRLAVKDLLVSLSEIGVPVSAPESEIAVPEPVEVEKEPEETGSLPDLDALFVQAEKLEKVTADAFWDAATGEDRKDAPGADTISYEQARQLGLAPDEE
jgi:hypothetical protein